MYLKSNRVLITQKQISLRGASYHIESTIHYNCTHKIFCTAEYCKKDKLITELAHRWSTIDHDEERHQDAVFATYNVVPRILSVKKEMYKYIFTYADGIPWHGDVILDSNKHQTTQNINLYLKKRTAAKKDIVV
jgi:hypothetical protein